MTTDTIRRTLTAFLTIALGTAGLGLGLTACSGSTDDPTQTRQQSASVQPETIDGNPSCESLGLGDFEFKINGSDLPSVGSSQTYDLDDFGNTVTITRTGDKTFEWSSSLTQDAVIVKGGPEANLYDYTPEEASGQDDPDLHAPLNEKNGQFYGLSHVSFCYDYEVDVDKTANTSFTRTFDWRIDKKVTPATYDLFDGDSGTSKYTIDVTKDSGTDRDWAVAGTISIENNTPFEAEISGVEDVVSPEISATVDCGKTYPFALASGSDLTCSYSADLPDDSTRTNTATVSTSSDSKVGGNTATADVDFSNATITKVNDTITVTDTNGESWTFSDSGTRMYTRTFTCGGDAGTHQNVASIDDETGATDTANNESSATVEVTCRELTVQKTAIPSYTRTFQWEIDKTITALSSGSLTTDPPQLVLQEGDSGTVDYAFTLSQVGSTDSDHRVVGEITISNPHPSRDANLAGVQDEITPDTAGTIDETVTCPSLTVPSEGSITCEYSADLPDDSERTNTATADLINQSFSPTGATSTAGSTSFNGSTSVDFAQATVTTDNESVHITDTLAGFEMLNVGPYFGTTTESYTRTFTCNEDEGLQTNTVEIVETGQTDTADLDVVCEDPPDEEPPGAQGCTPGFWQGGKGAQLWNTSNDSDWESHCGQGTANPFEHSTTFDDYFDGADLDDDLSMFDLVSTGGGKSDKRKAARSLVAAYLNASCNEVGYPYTTSDLEALWKKASADNDYSFLDLNTELDEANNLGCPL